MTKGQPQFSERYVAHARARQAKRRMDDAQEELAKAEDEWHQACIECDRLDGVDGELDQTGGKDGA